MALTPTWQLCVASLTVQYIRMVNAGERALKHIEAASKTRLVKIDQTQKVGAVLLMCVYLCPAFCRQLSIAPRIVTEWCCGAGHVFGLQLQAMLDYLVQVTNSQGEGLAKNVTATARKAAEATLASDSSLQQKLIENSIASLESSESVRALGIGGGCTVTIVLALSW